MSAVLGYNTIGGTASATRENSIAGSWFVAPYTGDIGSITAYLIVTTTAHLTKCAIYAYTADNNAGALLGSSDEVSVGVTTGAWQSFTCSTPIAVTAGTKYFVCVWSQSTTGDITTKADSSTAKGISVTSTYGTWPNPLTGEAGGNSVYSIYAEYTGLNIISTSKTVAYAVVTPPSNAVSTSKTVGYAVIQPPDGTDISKALVYSVTIPISDGTNVSKVLFYSVIAPVVPGQYRMMFAL